MVIKIGEKAPDFTLEDQKGNDISLSMFKGKKVILSFHPLVWTDICAKQMQSLELNKYILDSLDTVALGISIDSKFTKKCWADVMAISDTKLLADFHPIGQVAKSYGVFREENGFTKRTNIIVNENQDVVFVKVYPIKKLPNMDEIIEFLKQ